MFLFSPNLVLWYHFPCFYYRQQFCQWALFDPGKQLDLSIHHGATGPFVMSGYGGYKQQQSPKGRLFAFDNSGKYILTCAPYGGIIYEVRILQKYVKSR